MYRLFVDASDLAAEERAPFLNKACGQDAELRHEVETLLVRDARPSAFLNTPLVESERVFETLGSLTQGEMPCVPDRIGEYTIHNVLGDGGMGIVYLASKESPPRRVALKIIRPGAASEFSLRRFEHEAAVLARLQHPGIAQIFETGTAETDSGPRPFFAMEFVDGMPITDYSQSSNLSVKDQLELMAKVCDAVAHAHQKSVIHRDLKPGNIFVDASGQPKILDFGIARLTDSDIQTTTLGTLAGHVIGTLAYMSPEQATGDLDAVDTRSDVYSLGVVLYELLAGRRPFDLGSLSIPEALRTIREHDPDRLHSISSIYRGDLDTLVARALEKDKDRRYQSPSDLAADIRRWLADEPITARPPSAVYQLRKFARRNRGLVAGLVVATVALVGGIVATSAALLAAISARDESARQAANSDMLVQFLNDDLFAAIGPERLGHDATMLEVINEASKAIEGRFTDAPLVEARIRMTLGDVYRLLEESARGEHQVQRAFELRTAVLGEEHPETLASAHLLAALRFMLGKRDEAAVLWRQTYERRRRILGEDDPETLASQKLVAMTLDTEEDAWEMLLDNLERRRRVLGPEHPDTLSTLTNVAIGYAGKRMYEEAEKLFVEVLEGRRRALGPEHHKTLRALNNLGGLYMEHGRYQEAEPLLLESLDLRRRRLGEEHSEVAQAYQNLGNLYKHLRRPDSAESYFRKAIELNIRLAGEESLGTLNCMSDAAQFFAGQNRFEEAEQLYLRIIAVLPEPVYGVAMRRYGDSGADHAPTHERTVESIESLVGLYEAWDKPERAAEWRKKLPPEESHVPDAESTLRITGTKSQKD